MAPAKGEIDAPVLDLENVHVIFPQPPKMMLDNFNKHLIHLYANSPSHSTSHSTSVGGAAALASLNNQSRVALFEAGTIRCCDIISRGGKTS